MKKLAVLCTVCVILSITFLPVYAMGMTGAGSGGGEAAMSEEAIPSEGAPFDAGNNARTGDTRSSGGARDGSAGGTAQGSLSGTETDQNTAESGNPGARSAEESAGMTTGDSGTDSGTSWFAVILSIIVVAAIIALIVALLPRRNRA